MGVAPEDLHLPSLFLAWKAPGSTLHWERWEALRQLCLAHETLSMAAWSEAIHRLALQVGVDAEPPDNRLEISRAQELLKENAWATRQSSWHRRGWPRPWGSTRPGAPRPAQGGAARRGPAEGLDTWGAGWMAVVG